MSRPNVRQPSGASWRGLRPARPRPGLEQLTAAVIGRPEPWRPRSIRELDAWTAHIRLPGGITLGNGGRVPGNDEEKWTT